MIREGFLKEVRLRLRAEGQIGGNWVTGEQHCNSKRNVKCKAEEVGMESVAFKKRLGHRD